MAVKAETSAPMTTAALIVTTAAWNVLQNRVLPRWSYVPANLAGAATALGVARRLEISAAEMGIARANVRRGVRTGLALGSLLAAAIAAGVGAPRTRNLFADERAAGLSLQALAHETAVRIPIGTALFEEVLFRGLLLGWLRGRTSPLKALLQSSALFGLWHVLPTRAAMPGYAGGVLRSRPEATATGVVATGVAITAAAGAGFGWLRTQTGSLAAPAIVHAMINGAGFVGAWTVMRASRERSGRTATGAWTGR